MKTRHPTIERGDEGQEETEDAKATKKFNSMSTGQQ